MSLYRLDASIRVEGSHSRAIADIVEQEWRNARPGEPVIRRHVGVDPIPATTWATAVAAGRTPEASRTEEQAPVWAAIAAWMAVQMAWLPAPITGTESPRWTR
jgi:FMN-dependent NADH-azoreductase